tara:strand:+ start:501 stop:662 length:162 start_codon:yes stop_codon:yes gene_type:complete
VFLSGQDLVQSLKKIIKKIIKKFELRMKGSNVFEVFGTNQMGYYPSSAVNIVI